MAEQRSLPRLTIFEIIVHGLADGFSLYILLGLLRRGMWEAVDLIEAAVALLAIVLSAVIAARRFRPDLRSLGKLQAGLSALLGTFGGIAAMACLWAIWGGETYQGSSDGGAMAVMSGYYVYYPTAALIVLPFLLNHSRLSPRLRHLVWGLTFLLPLLPWCLVLGLRQLRHFRRG